MQVQSCSQDHDPNICKWYQHFIDEALCEQHFCRRKMWTQALVHWNPSVFMQVQRCLCMSYQPYDLCEKMVCLCLSQKFCGLIFHRDMGKEEDVM